MKKLLSVFLAAVMLFGTFGVCLTAQAAEADCITVTVTGTQMNGNVKAALDEINSLRTANGIAELTADKYLTSVAKRYAAALELHYDSDFNLPDGTFVSFDFGFFPHDVGAFMLIFTAVYIKILELEADIRRLQTVDRALCTGVLTARYGL